MGLVFPIILLLAVGGQCVWQSVNKGSIDAKSTRVAGARDTLPNEVPYIVHIYSGSVDEKDATYCGGTIYNKQYIITAAHCLQKNGAPRHPRLWVEAGTHRKGSDAHAGQILVSRWTVHEDYNEQTGENNIAVVELWSDLALGANGVNRIEFSPQKLNHFDESIVSQKATVSGYGNKNKTMIDQAPAPSPVGWDPLLQVLDVTLVPRAKCEGLYKNAKPEDLYKDPKNIKNGRPTVPKTAFCAGLVPLTGTGPCLGDDGGPLLCARNDGDGNTKNYLCGIYAGGSGCGLKIPQIYTDVALYRTWIDETTKRKWKGKDCPTKSPK